MFVYASDHVIAMASKVTNESDKSEIALLEQPHQLASFAFPKRNFGSSQRAFQSAWFVTWKWLHYCEADDSVLCHTCAYVFKEHKLVFEWHPCNDIRLCGDIAKLYVLLKKQPSFMYQLHILFKKASALRAGGSTSPSRSLPYLAHLLLPGVNFRPSAGSVLACALRACVWVLTRDHS